MYRRENMKRGGNENSNKRHENWKKMTGVQWNMKIFFLPPNCEIIFGSLSKCDSKIGLFSFASHKVISLPTLQ